MVDQTGWKWFASFDESKDRSDDLQSVVARRIEDHLLRLIATRRFDVVRIRSARELARSESADVSDGCRARANIHPVVLVPRRAGNHRTGGTCGGRNGGPDLHLFFGNRKIHPRLR